jgi:hypothetical protein
MDDNHGRAMVSFGAIMLILVGAFNVLDGIVAIANASYFKNDILFADLKTWGWFFTIYGVVQVVVGAALYGGSRAARWPAIALAGFNALAQLSYVSHYPAWSIVMIVVDGVVIYAIATYGAALEQARVPDAWTRPAPSPSEARAAGPHFG